MQREPNITDLLQQAQAGLAIATSLNNSSFNSQTQEEKLVQLQEGDKAKQEADKAGQQISHSGKPRQRHSKWRWIRWIRN